MLRQVPTICCASIENALFRKDVRKESKIGFSCPFAEDEMQTVNHVSESLSINCGNPRQIAKNRHQTSRWLENLY
jgi:hypothetical protein